jgi:CHAT domain-containing protein
MNRPDPTDVSLLAISQPNAPHYPSIPKTRDEVAQIVELLTAQGGDTNTNVEWLDGTHATVSAVYEAMSKHSCIHFACHAMQHPSDPTKSAFMLADGYLTLIDIIRSRRANKDLAILSACQTATGDAKLAEEAVHLASGMLVAGYRSVIATAWSIMDDDGPVMAKVVHEELLRRGSGRLQGRGSAEALHKAVAILRARGSEFVAWVPFMHLGV